MSKGKIFLVGLGPGAGDQMSGRARQAVAASQVVIGYTKYVDLVQDLLDGKEVIRKAMTQEVDRCVAACERARAGKIVALVSSGDIGVYGMAGLTYEVLLQSGWGPGQDIEVEVVPGITALSSCASLVGAPLSHDFCSISLSDLLTPWPVIARRLEAAARGDFVVALYNPRSGRRQGQLVQAKRILLRHRRSDTPIAIVNAAYRERQAVQIATLAEITDCDVGMLSTVLVGNSNTYCRAGLMITPRGYGHKYEELTGNVKQGEKSGHSLSIGLDGWKACVREYLRDTAAPSLQDVADRFDAPIGEVLSAIGEATGDDGAGEYRAAAVAPGNEGALLDAARSWGTVQVVIRSGAGAEAELLLNADELHLRGNRLTLENTHCRLHADWSRIERGWFLSRDDRVRGLQFIDAAGDTVFELTLIQEHGRFQPEALANYELAWRLLASEARKQTGSPAESR